MAHIRQEQCIDEKTMKRFIEAFGKLPSFFDSRNALFDTVRDITPVAKVAKESKKVTEVMLHEPGEIITLEGNRQYEVQDDGKWKRIN